MQPLSAVKLFDVECNQLEYRAVMDWEVENIKTGFQPAYTHTYVHAYIQIHVCLSKYIHTYVHTCA